MKIQTASSGAEDTAAAVNECLSNLGAGSRSGLSWLYVFHTEGYDGEIVRHRIQSVVGPISLQGGTSSMGVMTERGFVSRNGRGMGMLAIADAEGSYGVGAAAIGEDPRAAARTALEAALDDAGRPGEVPTLVWLHAAPGREEELIDGIQDLIGPDVPVAGGSTADNTVSGNWRQLSRDGVFHDAVVISAFFPSVDVAYAFHSGYDPTEVQGTVTKADGRSVIEIDHRPGAEVYNAWTGGLIAGALKDGGRVLTDTTLYPLGREVGRVGGVPYYKLSHPQRVSPEGTLQLFTSIGEGDRLVLMQGSRDTLISRAGRVTRAAMVTGSIEPDDVAGAIVIYCAGCMLTVRDEMPLVAEEVGAALGNAPFLGVFTFGEQGCFVGHENSHGNLMISVVVFSRKPAL